MKKFLIFLAILIIVPIGVGAAIVATGNTMNVMNKLLAPDATVETEEKAPAPDYTKAENWAALPTMDDLADLTPEGIVPRASDYGVDVFFIHPTGLIKGTSWNFRMDPNTNTEENTKWMMANQASAYNGCCEVYAPRYRQAGMFVYLSGNEDTINKGLAFAYQDVEAAFDYFLEQHSKGRPFVLASHSQGTHHAVSLLKNRISGTELRDRMVAAYIIGGGTSHQQLEDMPDIAPCDAPDDLHCVIHFATYGDGGSSDEEWMVGDQICTNPLTWRDEGGRADASSHKGAVSTSGDFTIEFHGDDKPKGIHFGPLGAPIPEHTWAECIDGDLIIADQSETPFSRGEVFGSKNYHGLDYPMFYMDIRENAVLRVHTYLSSRVVKEAEPGSD